jgi:glycosyltransferase involved in cell wall biosynthesis
MSLGRPVIAASVGGIPEMIQHGETGMLFENEDSDELARLIVLLADDEKLRRDIGERGRDFIVKHRGMAEFSRQISEVIDDTFRNFTS